MYQTKVTTNQNNIRVDFDDGKSYTIALEESDFIITNSDSKSIRRIPKRGLVKPQEPINIGFDDGVSLNTQSYPTIEYLCFVLNSLGYFD